MVGFFSQGKMEYQCGHCGIIEEIMQRCSSCHVVYYCSRHCQKKDWKEKHRMVCNRLKYGYDPEEELTSESSDSSINVVYSSESCANCGDQGYYVNVRNVYLSSTAPSRARGNTGHVIRDTANRTRK